ncbi:MAG: hypothetical protein Q8K60_04130, partial [Parachlamydiaceae bacterium]|nr:hypothetical protein [Parachlamydiaceae bacterium]
AISDAILDALQFKLGEKKVPDSKTVEKLLLTIQKIINQNINIQYDPDIRRDLLTESQTKEAGFILYYNTYRIDNQIKFINFILLILNKSKEKISQNLKKIEEEELNQILNILIPYIPSYQFICYVLIKYFPSNNEILKLAAKKKNHSTYQFQYTPWITKIGSNSKALMKVYFEKEFIIEAESFILKNAEQALIKMIDFCKAMKQEEKVLFYFNPYKFIPFCITGKHRFPFMPGHPSLLRAWNDSTPTYDWLESTVIQPGLEIANSIIDKTTAKNLLKKIDHKILPHFFTPEIKKMIFSQIDRIDKKMKIKAYRDAIINVCEHALADSSKEELLKREIDSAICQSLSIELKTKLENSTVYFGDTNWNQGIHDLHFCFLINPGTAQLELFESYSNGTNLKALDQNYWLINQKWEFLTKEELLLDDLKE